MRITASSFACLSTASSGSTPRGTPRRACLTADDTGKTTGIIAIRDFHGQSARLLVHAAARLADMLEQCQNNRRNCVKASMKHENNDPVEFSGYESVES
jgi:hypothetical protein